jgi:hypothetical protein
MHHPDLLSRLRQEHQIDEYIDVPLRAKASENPAMPAATFNAYEFVWRHGREPYALTVYHLGHEPAHDFMWPYLMRYPGLVLLRHTTFHEARARRLVPLGRVDDYRDEFRYNHPDSNHAPAELLVSAFTRERRIEPRDLALTNGAYARLWPMRRAVVESARLVAVDNPRVAAQLEGQHPGAAFITVSAGVPGIQLSAEARLRVRDRLGIPRDAVVFGVCEAIGASARAKTIVDAFEAACGDVRHARLLPFSADGPALHEWLAATDICIALRWPPTGETSASWLTALAAGKPTITTELSELADVPMLEPYTWHPTTTASDAAMAVAVSIGTFDEEQALRLAMRRLALDGDLRDRLGLQAHAYWRAHHTFERMLADLQHAVVEAARRPAPALPLPGHLRPDALGEATQMLRQFHLENPFQ